MGSQLKKKNFREVDQTRRCRICGKALKVNLLMKKIDADLCYQHFIAQEKARKSRR